MTKKIKDYNSESIQTLKGIEGIRLRPAMYIGSTDEDGLHHLLLEVISNSIDECLNGHGESIEIKIDSKTNTVSVRDYGRGIPFGPTKDGTEALIEVVTNIHSGGKFEEDNYTVSGGLHGIGITAVNALSKTMEIESYRDEKMAKAIFTEGINSSMKVVKNTKNKKRGTLITFTPDKKFFDDSVFEYNRIKEQVELLSFLTRGVRFYLDFDGEIESFYSEEGIKDLVAKNAPNKTTDIFYIQEETKGFDIEVAFTFTKKTGEKITAFTNNIPNTAGGTHITGFKRATTTGLNRLAKAHLLVDQDEKNFTGEMLRSGIVASISVKMSGAPMFQGQTKEKLVSKEVSGVVSSAITNTIDSIISRKDLETIIEKAIAERRAEEAAKKARDAAKKVVSGGRNLKMISDLPEKLVDCNQSNGELFLVEGDSAAGSATEGRDSRFQAILPLRGKVLNTHSKVLSDIVNNKEVKDIFTTLGCGVGDKFKIDNLRYDKIVLLADADPDGAHINVLIITLFLMHLPEIIEEGKLYRAVPPFYKFKKGNKMIYLKDDDAKEEYIKKFGQPKDLTRFKGIGEMNSKELWETTMNPENRNLVQLTTDDIEDSVKLFDILMGNSSAARKEFIMENTKKVM